MSTTTEPDMKKVIDLLRKLKALADNGIDGEKETAEDMLARLMAKHNVTWFDLSMKEKREITLRWKSDLELRIVSQIVCHVATYPECNFSKHPKQNKMYVYGPVDEMMLIEAMYDFYKAEWYKQLDVFYQAFVQKQGVFANSTWPDFGVKKPDLSREEIFRLQQMSEGIPKAVFHKQLREG